MYDNPVSWLVLLFIMIFLMCRSASRIIQEIEQRKMESEEAWREEGK